MCVCVDVCVCVRANVRARVRACMRVCVHACMFLYVYVDKPYTFPVFCVLLHHSFLPVYVQLCPATMGQTTQDYLLQSLENKKVTSACLLRSCALIC